MEETLQETTIKKKRKKRFRLRKRTKLIIILCYEVFVGILMCYILFLTVSLNASDDVNYADQSGIDVIKCDENTLMVNDVSVKVPSEGNVSYSISYAWGEKDKKYPTIPRSITASYKSEKGKELYDISLYKDSFTPNKKMKLGKNYANWFRGWKTGKEGNITREHKDTDNVHGFLIDTINTDEDALVYENISYYFTVPSDEGVTVYILEANLYDHNSKKIMQKSLDSAISSIKAGAPKPKKNEDGDNPLDIEEQAA